MLSFAALVAGVSPDPFLASDVAGGDPALEAALSQHWLTAEGFVPYFNYAGNLQVQGSVSHVITVSEGGGTQKFLYTLRGVDPWCGTFSGPNASQPNSCGIHIHEGTDCTSDALGHYWNKDEITADPWADVTYRDVGPEGSATVGLHSVTTALYESDIDGHVFIVHDYQGTRIACAVLGNSVLIGAGGGASPEQNVLASAPVEFVQYFNYPGPLDGSAVSGTISPMVEYGKGAGLGQAFAFTLWGVDPACKDGPDPSTPNSCGVHIHEGTDCTSDALGHYWNKALIADDPWADVHYVTYDMGGGCSAEVTGTTGPGHCTTATRSSFKAVTTGLSLDAVKGHAFIVHAFNGARIACSVLADPGASLPLSAGGFVPYFDYAGDLRVSGVVTPMATLPAVFRAPSAIFGGASAFLTPTQSFAYSLRGVDPNCASGPTAGVANSCGIHIHEGTDCASNALGHYWARGSFPDDPWASVSYRAESGLFGRYTATGVSPGVITGLYQSQIAGHAFIVHDVTGARIACAILQSCPDGCEAQQEQSGGLGTAWFGAEGATGGRRAMLFASQPHPHHCPPGCAPMPPLVTG